MRRAAGATRRASCIVLFVLVSALTLDAQSRLFVSASAPTGTLTGAIDLSTGRVEWAAPTPQLSHLLTTADGKYLVVPLQGSLFLGDVDTKAVTQLAPSIQVDGSTVIAHPRRLEFYALLADGPLASITPQAVRTLFSCPTGIGGPDISGDGRRLVVTCGQDIVVLDADTGAVTNRFSAASAIGPPTTNADGSRVVVTQYSVQAGTRTFGLALYDVATGARLVVGPQPWLGSGYRDITPILATTPSRDALVAVALWTACSIRCFSGYETMVVEFDTLAMRHTFAGAARLAGFSADGQLAVLGWTAAIRLVDVASGATLSRLDLTAVASESLTLTLANAPLPPANPTAHVSRDRVTLSWTQPIASAATTRYVIEAGRGPGLSDVVVYNVDGGQTSITANNVAAGRYYVRIRAVNFTGTSAPSQEIVVNVM